MGEWLSMHDQMRKVQEDMNKRQTAFIQEWQEWQPFANNQFRMINENQRYLANFMGYNLPHAQNPEAPGGYGDWATPEYPYPGPGPQPHSDTGEGPQEPNPPPPPEN